MNESQYEPMSHGSFDEEWGIHPKSSEWWSVTGILRDREDNLYSYRYTLLRGRLGVLHPTFALISLTDYRNQLHYALQLPVGSLRGVRITDREVSVGSHASAVKGKNAMRISLRHREFSLDVLADYGRGAVWQGSGGLVQAGVSDGDKAHCYSYPNMPSGAMLRLQGRTLQLHGSSWFDRQWGSFSPLDPSRHWDRFTLRFFDGEEMMLLTFPQSSTFDGTYIRSDGSYERMHLYSCRAVKTVHTGRKTWSALWEISVPHKEGAYTLEPVQKGHMSFGCFETLCSIRNASGTAVGWCLTEQLPGVRRGGAAPDAWKLLHRGKR